MNNIETIRAKIAARKEPCSPNCPGWAVFNVDTEPVVETCDECWHGVPDPLTSDELTELPEAEHELLLAVEDGGGYEQPDVKSPCTCGCTVWHMTGDRKHEQCSACGESRQSGATTSAVQPKRCSLPPAWRHVQS